MTAAVDLTFTAAATLAITWDVAVELTATGLNPASLTLSMVSWTTPDEPGVDVSNFTASGAVGGHRVVKTVTPNKVTYADRATAADALKAIGISLGAAADAAAVRVQTYGPLTEPSWGWTPEAPIYCGLAGVLTQVVPSSGFVLVVGVATAPTSMFVNFQPPLVIA